MEQQTTERQLHTLMNENSLSALNKENIISKINNLLEFMWYLNTAETIDNTLVQELSGIYSKLSKEQKSTAKIIVSKNNSLSKNLIKSMAYQKENMLQVIEISQLRLEAELKELNSKISYPAIKANSSLFSRIFNIFKIPFKNTTSAKQLAVKPIREKIKLTTSKLNDLEKQKENLSKEFGCTGTEALKYLNKITYNSFLPVSNVSKSTLERLKSKITILNN